LSFKSLTSAVYQVPFKQDSSVFKYGLDRFYLKEKHLKTSKNLLEIKKKDHILSQKQG
jgi:hypothetical protein